MVRKKSLWPAMQVAVLSTLALALGACGGDGGGADIIATPSGVRIEPDLAISIEAPGSHCAAGGSRIDAGVDADGGGSPSQLWTSVASSADGRKLVAVGQSTHIHTSSDGGQTWVAHQDQANSDRMALAISAAGDRIATGDSVNPTATTRPVLISVATTTPGSAGSISGGPFDAITLQYRGNSRFQVLSHEGELGIE